MVILIALKTKVATPNPFEEEVGQPNPAEEEGDHPNLFEEGSGHRNPVDGFRVLLGARNVPGLTGASPRALP